jgi:hypothetical protein
MKSYSDSVADTDKVSEVEQKLTALVGDSQLNLAKTIAANADIVADQGKTIKLLKLRANLQGILIALIVITDIIRHGF